MHKFAAQGFNCQHLETGTGRWLAFDLRLSETASQSLSIPSFLAGRHGLRVVWDTCKSPFWPTPQRPSLPSKSLAQDFHVCTSLTVPLSLIMLRFVISRKHTLCIQLFHVHVPCIAQHSSHLYSTMLFAQVWRARTRCRRCAPRPLHH